MLRITVRILGLSLLAVGVCLWALKVKDSHAIGVPVALNASSHTFPAKHHGVNRNSAGAPLSTVTLKSASPVAHVFYFHLFKSDGWFDTGLPITPDLRLWLNCPTETPPCTGFVQAKVGTTTIPPLRIEENPRIDPVITRTKTEQRPPGEISALVEDRAQNLKLRIVPEAGSSDLTLRLKVSIIPLDGRTELTPLQQQEQEAMQKREVK